MCSSTNGWLVRLTTSTTAAWSSVYAPRHTHLTFLSPSGNPESKAAVWRAQAASRWGLGMMHLFDTVRNHARVRRPLHRVNQTLSASCEGLSYWLSCFALMHDDHRSCPLDREHPVALAILQSSGVLICLEKQPLPLEREWRCTELWSLG